MSVGNHRVLKCGASELSPEECQIFCHMLSFTGWSLLPISLILCPVLQNLEKKKFPVCSQEVFLGTGANNHRSASQDPFGLAEEIIMEINPEFCDGSEPGVSQHSQGCTWKPRSELPEIHREIEKVWVSSESQSYALEASPRFL